jgi:hypothetical protein
MILKIKEERVWKETAVDYFKDNYLKQKSP